MNEPLHSMITMTASEAGAQFEDLIEQVGGSDRPVCIVGNRNSAILVSIDHWRSMEETLCLLSLPGMRDSIKREMGLPRDSSAERLDWGCDRA